jgi:hypothetical protein
VADREKNPFEPGTARFREWNRRNKSPRRVEKKLKSKGDDTNRRKRLDDAIEKAQAARIKRMRSGQFSDESNDLV